LQPVATGRNYDGLVPSIVSGAGYATFINIFRCSPSDQDEVARINIDIVEHVASRSPGFISHTRNDHLITASEVSGHSILLMVLLSASR
jgi:hypothetical protein